MNNKHKIAENGEGVKIVPAAPGYGLRHFIGYGLGFGQGHFNFGIWIADFIKAQG
jgi:hypothetical protein